MGEIPQTFTALGIASSLLCDASENTGPPRVGRASLSVWLSAAKTLSKSWGPTVAWGCRYFSWENVQQARIHLEQVIVFYDPEQHRALAFVYGVTWGLLPFPTRLGFYGSWAIPIRPSTGSRRRWPWLESWITPFPWPYALVMAGAISICSGEIPRSSRDMRRKQCDFPWREGSLSSKHGLPEPGVGPNPAGRGGRGNCPDAAGPGVAGDLWAWKLAVPAFLAWLAEAYGKAGRAEEGLSLAGGGAGPSGEDRRARLGSGGASGQGRAVAIERQSSPRPRPPSARPSRSPGDRRRNPGSCVPPSA